LRWPPRRRSRKESITPPRLREVQQATRHSREAFSPRFSLCCGREGCRHRGHAAVGPVSWTARLPRGRGDRGERGGAHEDGSGGHGAGDGRPGAQDAALARLVAGPVRDERSFRGAYKGSPSSTRSVALRGGVTVDYLIAAPRTLVPLQIGAGGLFETGSTILRTRVWRPIYSPADRTRTAPTASPSGARERRGAHERPHATNWP
jgi:hypothetical protein